MTSPQSRNDEALNVPWFIESGPTQRWGDRVAICYGAGGGEHCITHVPDIPGYRKRAEHIVEAHNATLRPASEKKEAIRSESADIDRKDAERYRWIRDRKPNQLHLNYNDHACNYVTAKVWIEEYQPDTYKDEPQEAVQAMKDADTIWTLQVYPNTPVGFNWIHRATLDAVIDEAMKEGL